jgi:hypothetical protein
MYVLCSSVVCICVAGYCCGCNISVHVPSFSCVCFDIIVRFVSSTYFRRYSLL